MQLVRDEEHHDVVVGAVRRAKRRVWIASANVKEMLVDGGRGSASGRWQSVLAVLDRLARGGVELRLLHAALPSRPFRDTFDRFERLCAGGLQLRMCPRVHLKTVIVDGRFLYLGSANWTGAGLGAKGEYRRNFELGMITEDEAVLDQVQALYASIWEGAACAKCALRDVCEAPLSL
jgi:phosphatidylserine/phosphatidylglycerophosphate/cardiolipin synthase-like enzyme